MFDLSLSLYAVISFVLIGLVLSLIILFTRARLVSSAPCKININHDDTLTKYVEGGNTLLAALSANAIAVPSPCGGKATCKQCKVQVVEGGGDILETDRATFSPKDLKAGWRLSCQCKVKGDIGILLPEHLLELKEFTVKVLSNKNVATFIKELVVEVSAEQNLQYRPGDYLQFHVPPFKTNTSEWKETMDAKYFSDWEKYDLFNRDIDFTGLREEVIRAYSMASHPSEGNILKF